MWGEWKKKTSTRVCCRPAAEVLHVETGRGNRRHEERSAGLNQYDRHGSERHISWVDQAWLSNGLCRYGNSVECCWGWRQMDGGRCQPHCQQGCKHGECVRPDRCKCHPGYSGKACNQDLNECGLKPRPCKHRCMNTPGSYKCYCLDGYTLQPDGSCKNTLTCYHANCQYGCEVSKGVVRCTCPSPGLRLGPDRRTCIDIDECVSGSGVCPRRRKCVNTFGSFMCKCHHGFKLMYMNGRYVCIDKDTRPFCSLNPSSPKCRCKDGGCEALPRVNLEPQRPRTTTPIIPLSTAAPLTTTTTQPVTTTTTTATTTLPATSAATTTTPTTTVPTTTTTTPVIITAPVTQQVTTTTAPVTTTTTPFTTTTAPVTTTTTHFTTTTTPVTTTTTPFTTTTTPVIFTTPVTTTTTPVIITTPVTTTTTPVTTPVTTTTTPVTTPVTTTTTLVIITTPVTTTTTPAIFTTPDTTTPVPTTPAATPDTTTVATTLDTTPTPVTTPDTTTPATTPDTTTTSETEPVTTPDTTTTPVTTPVTTPDTTPTLPTTISMVTTTLNNRLNKDVTLKQRGDVHIPRNPNLNQVWEFDIELGNTADDARDDPEAGVLHCTFDHGLCDWLSDREGDLHWETSHNPEGGQYLSVPELKAGQRSIRGARLAVQIVPPWSHGDLCFSFSHWLTGHHVGVLQLYIRKRGRGQRYSPALWSRTGGHGWRHTQVTLTTHPLDKVLLKAERRLGQRGQIAVDDVTLRQGAC